MMSGAEQTMRKVWRDRGERDYLAGEPIDRYYRYPGNRERYRSAYESGWRGAKLDLVKRNKGLPAVMPWGNRGIK